MKRLLIFGLTLVVAGACPAQSTKASRAADQSKMPAVVPDPAIAAALRQVSAAHVRATIEKLVSFGTRSTLSVEQPAASGHGIAAARDWLKSEFERYSQECGGCLEVKLDTFIQPPQERIRKPTEISNVYAVLRGSDPQQAKRIFLVTGHYDSRNSDNFNTTDPAPGANDDASGTAVSLECARILSKMRFPATIIFLTVAGEEQGLDGSAHFAKMAKEQGWQIEAALNNDIVGGNRTPGDGQQDSHTVRVFSEGVPAAASEAELKLLRALGGESDSSSRQLARAIAEVGRAYLPATFQPTLIFRLDRYLRGGDHASFNREGFAAVRFTEWREDYNHQHQTPRTENGVEYGDWPKFVDFDYVANVARLNSATLAALASAPAAPASVKLETKQLQNDSTLTWESAAGAVAYEILWRATDAADWQNAKSVGKVIQATLPISKDNVIFAVRSVDAKGHKSIPVVPAPER
ncbi:MAG: peptidase M28 [Acidobacteria bacterium]|nr:MAG: peptidase M28 [Acidobacteriota bacterium]